MREFSAAIRPATRCAPPHELAAILAGLKRQRRAALGCSTRKASLECRDGGKPS